MFSTKFHEWNSVDISNGESGVYLARGIVVDKAKTGLLVDFGTANKDPQLVPFDRIIHQDEPTDLSTCDCVNKDSANFEVLLQLSVEEPWTWYPAVILTGTRDFLLMKAKLSDGHSSVTDVVRYSQVRCCICARRETAVFYSDFLKERVPVPYDDFVVTPSFRKLWTGKSSIARTYPIGIVNKKIYYIQRRYDKGLRTSSLVNDIDEIMRDTATNNRGVKRFHEDIKNENALHLHIHSKTELTISDMPYHVLHVLLSHLETVELIRYRRVCPLWNSIITSMDTTKVVIYDMTDYENEDYVLANVLCRLVKDTTMCLIITLAKQLRRMRNWTCFTLLVAKNILDQTGIIIPILVLADLEIGRSDLLEPSYHRKTTVTAQQYKDGSTAISERLRNMCQRLLLKRVTLHDVFDYPEKTGENLTPYRNLAIPYADIKKVSITQWELRHALEPSVLRFMKSVDQCDIERLSSWISKAGELITVHGIPYSMGDFQCQKRIIQDLRTWEGDDRRFGPECTWKDVEAAQLSSNLDTLHSITVMSLLYGMKQCAVLNEEDHSDNDDEEEESEELDSMDHESSDESLF